MSLPHHLTSWVSLLWRHILIQKRKEQSHNPIHPRVQKYDASAGRKGLHAAHWPEGNKHSLSSVVWFLFTRMAVILFLCFWFVCGVPHQKHFFYFSFYELDGPPVGLTVRTPVALWTSSTDSWSEHAISSSQKDAACVTALLQRTNSVFILSFPYRFISALTLCCSLPACSQTSENTPRYNHYKL